VYTLSFFADEPGYLSCQSDLLRTGRPEVRFPVCNKFLFAITYNPAQRPTRPLIQWVPERLSAGVKLPERDADHSSPCGAEVNNVWSCVSTPSICLRGVVLRHRGTQHLRSCENGASCCVTVLLSWQTVPAGVAAEQIQMTVSSRCYKYS
jgi:hypothetical protein